MKNHFIKMYPVPYQKITFFISIFLLLNVVGNTTSLYANSLSDKVSSLLGLRDFFTICEMVSMYVKGTKKKIGPNV